MYPKHQRKETVVGHSKIARINISKPLKLEQASYLEASPATMVSVPVEDNAYPSRHI